VSLKLKLVLTKKFISKLIEREIDDPSHVESAMNLLSELTRRNNTIQNFTIQDISMITHSQVNEDVWQLAFELSNLSIPLFTVYVIYYDESGEEEVIDEDEELVNIFSKHEIINPFNGQEYLSYADYKDHIEILFRANKELLENLKSQF